MDRLDGPAGTAIIARTSQDGNDGVKGYASAWLFVDNRYWIQAEGQTSKKLWEVVRVVPKDSPGITSPWEWCKKVRLGLKFIRVQVAYRAAFG